MSEPIDNTKINTNIDEIDNNTVTLNISHQPLVLFVEIEESEGMSNFTISQFNDVEKARLAHIELVKNISTSGFLSIDYPDGSMVSIPQHKIHHIHLAYVNNEQ